MPATQRQSPSHQVIPVGPTGYELAPLAGKGLWSIVSPAGVVTNLNSLGLQVLAYTGAGMPPVKNITTPYGVLGGSVYQRTVVPAQHIVLVCVVQGEDLGVVQRIKQKVLAQIVPSNSLQAGKALKLRFQLVNYCGDAVGTALEVPVYFEGDAGGNMSSLYQDRFNLSFVELMPPSIKELTTVQPSLSYAVATASAKGMFYRTASGQWVHPSGLSESGALMYDLTGELWYFSATFLKNKSGTVSQSFYYTASPLISQDNALAYDVNNKLYIGGYFTSPQNYIAVYDGSTFGAVGSTINGSVHALAFDNQGNLYAGGEASGTYAMTAPSAGAGKWNGTSWSALGSGFSSPGQCTAIVKGLDGNMYFGGIFTKANGVTVNSICYWNGTTFVPLGSGISGGTLEVNALAVMPDGRIIAGGSFTGAGGVTCSNVAAWNGTQWQPLGSNQGVVKSLFVHPLTGELYANGAGGANNLTAFNKWNGTTWISQDFTVDSIFSFAPNTISIRASDGEIAIGIIGANTNNGALNVVTYTGTADVNPQIKFTGPGKLYAITNYTTGKAIYFNNYVLLAGETATLTTGGPNGISFVSSYLGNVLSKIYPGSDTATFSLVPGNNNVSALVTGGTGGVTKVELIYQNTHWSFEAGA